jgi:hypothetical protein
MLNTGTTTVPKVFVSKGPNKGKKQQDRPDKGKLPRQIPEPRFVADPNHRKKVLTGKLHDLAKKQVVERFTMTKMDCTRIGKNFGYCSDISVSINLGTRITLSLLLATAEEESNKV